MFQLHPTLAADTVPVCDLALCRVLLMNNVLYPWLILVPMRDGIREIHQLKPDDRVRLLEESCRVASLMEALFKPHKMNVASLGNVVPQLHLHHVARFTDDGVWPDPVWGQVPARPYRAEEAAALAERIRAAL